MHRCSQQISIFLLVKSCIHSEYQQNIDDATTFEECYIKYKLIRYSWRAAPALSERKPKLISTSPNNNISHLLARYVSDRDLL